MKNTRCFDCKKNKICSGEDKCSGLSSVYRLPLFYGLRRFLLSILFLMLLVVSAGAEETAPKIVPLNATIIPGNAKIHQIICQASISVKVDGSMYIVEYTFLATSPGNIGSDIVFPGQATIYRVAKAGEINIGSVNALFYAGNTVPAAEALVSALLKGETIEHGSEGIDEGATE